MKIASAGASQSSGTKLLISICASIVAAMAVICAVWFVFLASSPEGTVKAYIEASKNGDVKKINALLSARSTKIPGLFGELMKRASKETEDLDYSIGVAEITGNSAIVPVTSELSEQAKEMGFPGKEITIRMGLIKEEGVWKIDAQRSALLMMEDVMKVMGEAGLIENF